jgi:plastocyanin
VSRRLLILATFPALLAACAGAPKGEVDFGEGVRFVPTVADSVDDVGLGASVAVGPDGAPYIAYLGFPTQVAEGQIAPTRPIGSPFVPGVLLASVSAEGIWTRGAVEQIEPAVAPPGVTIPFGPRSTPGLALTPQDAAGTSVAVGADGSIHVAWTSGGAVFYAKASPTTTADVQQVADLGGGTGSVSRPGIALDADGNPWVAFSAELDGLLEVIAATPGKRGWDHSIVTEAGCDSCTPLTSTGIGTSGGSPVVVYPDPGEGALKAAALGDEGWEVQEVDAGADGLGLAVTSAGDKVYASYYTGSGSVSLAVFGGSGWTTSDVAQSGAPENEGGTAADNTSVTVDAGGTIWVAWDDAGVRLASGDGSTFQEVATVGTAGGAHPGVAAGAGGVYLAWYDTAGRNLMVGILGENSDVLLAKPSPRASVSLAPSGGAECGADGKEVLDLVAKSSLFDPTCLVAIAGEDFTINLDNQDAGIVHNINIFTEQGGDSIAATTLEPGPVQQTLDVAAMDAGSYYFQCDAHPTTMVGALVVIEARKK